MEIEKAHYIIRMRKVTTIDTVKIACKKEYWLLKVPYDLDDDELQLNLIEQFIK